ncbi:MAG: RHS repeat protein [Planctomycetes bacterium]|nr:RHS repeat protein [Planctomycetota bacterium]
MADGTADTATSSTTYNTNGQPLTTTDALGNVTSDTYDAAGNLASETDAAGTVTTYAYNSANLVTSQTVTPAGASSGLTTSFTYDADGNQTSVTDAAGNTTSYLYNANGQCVRMTDALGNVTTYSYDAAGNRRSETDGLVATTGGGYAFTAASSTTTFTYDQDGNLLTQTRAAGTALAATTTNTYDGNGNLVRSVDPRENVTLSTYNAAGQLLTQAIGVTLDSDGGDNEANAVTTRSCEAFRAWQRSRARSRMAQSSASSESYISPASIFSRSVDMAFPRESWPLIHSINCHSREAARGISLLLGLLSLTRHWLPSNRCYPDWKLLASGRS